MNQAALGLPNLQLAKPNGPNVLKFKNICNFQLQPVPLRYYFHLYQSTNDVNYFQPINNMPGWERIQFTWSWYRINFISLVSTSLV